MPVSPPGLPLGETPPGRPLSPEDIAVLTDPGPDRVAGTAIAVRAGARPTVVADPAVLTWLATQGELTAMEAPRTIDDVEIDTLAYAPAPVDPRAASRTPARSLRRALAAARGPRAQPFATCLTLERGLRLVHLNLALHLQTAEAWLEAALARFRGAEWLICGVPPGATEAVYALLPRFEARRLLVADLTGDGVRAQAASDTPLTPLVDRLCADGLEAYVFATRSSLRFE